jgi:hypothetical protein
MCPLIGNPANFFIPHRAEIERFLRDFLALVAGFTAKRPHPYESAFPRTG